MNTISKVAAETDTDNQNTNKEQMIDANHGLKDIINLPNDMDEQEIQSFIDKEIHRLRSDEYMRRKMAATGKSEEKIRKDVEKMISQLWKTTLIFDKETCVHAGAGGVYSQDIKNPKIRVFEDEIFYKKESTNHEIFHALSEQALKTGDELIEFFNSKHKNYPKVKLDRWYDKLHPFETIQKWANNSPEQQVVAKRIMDYIEKTQGIKRGEKLTLSNIDELKNDMMKFIQKEDMRHMDIIYLMAAFKKKFGLNYPNKLLELLNNAY